LQINLVIEADLFVLLPIALT